MVFDMTWTIARITSNTSRIIEGSSCKKFHSDKFSELVSQM